MDAAKASLSGFERDIRNERTKAAVAVKGDILSLLKHSSLYLLATSYRGALAKLVYLHRAMHSSAGEGHHHVLSPASDGVQRCHDSVCTFLVALLCACHEAS